MFKKSVLCRIPPLIRRMRPPCSTTKRRPLLSAALAICTGWLNPVTVEARLICGQVMPPGVADGDGVAVGVVRVVVRVADRVGVGVSRSVGLRSGLDVGVGVGAANPLAVALSHPSAIVRGNANTAIVSCHAFCRAVLIYRAS